ncbi:MAG: hypothetical protein OER90_21165 [Gemmatimonadota bacterium]|nr:hypothetical protein [Gemmatimonadota bacterium]
MRRTYATQLFSAMALQTFRDIPDEQSILRPEMLHVLLRELPASREEWLRKVPLELRLETAPEHMVLLDDILAVLKSVVRATTPEMRWSSQRL